MGRPTDRVRAASTMAHMAHMGRSAETAGRPLDGASRSLGFRWLARRIGTRGAAVAWWLVMALFLAVIVNWWLDLAADPTPANAVLAGGVSLVMAVPLVSEARYARRMARMLVRGT